MPRDLPSLRYDSVTADSRSIVVCIAAGIEREKRRTLARRQGQHVKRLAYWLDEVARVLAGNEDARDWLIAGVVLAMVVVALVASR